MNCRKFLTVFCFAGTLLCSAAERFFPVVKDGKPVAALVMQGEDKACMEAMMIVEKYITRSTGCRLDVPAGAPQIVFEIRKGKMDPEGFRFSFPSARKMVITGGGPNGIRYGALDFCERFIGVRFLYPGPAGEHVPKLKDIRVPVKEFSDAPKFYTRFLYSSAHPTRKRYYDWLFLLRGCPPHRLFIGHSLYRMFPPSKYAEKHPDFYPVIKGKRYIPQAPNLGVHWQVCMTNPAVVEEAVRIICEAFSKDPDLRTWGLGQTDGDGYCECENCKKFYPNPDVPHRFGSKDRSVLYLQFCNRIAEGVAKKYPDARLSIFAYNHTSLAPKGFKLHPMLVPIITYDRLNWIDPERKAKDLERQKGWSDIAGEICWYDYFYSNSYVLPRVVCHHIARQLREGYRNRIRHMFAEYIPLGLCGNLNETLWGDGPQAYMTYKLLWDPFQEENKILDDWYQTAVGPKAAPCLRSYFERIEAFWTEQVPKSAWFKRCARTYLVWTWHDYLNVMDRDFFDNCAKDLDMACKLAPEGECKIRAEYFREVFRNRRNRCEFWLRNQKARLYDSKSFTKVFFQDGFERGIGNWTPWEHRKMSGEFAFFAPKDGVGNTGALELRARKNGSDCGVQKIFRITKPADFRMEVKFRCVGTDEKVIPYISAEWCDAKGEILHPAFYSDIHGKPDGEEWTSAAFNFTTPTLLPSYLKIRLSISTQTGKVLYDDFVLREVPGK